MIYKSRLEIKEGIIVGILVFFISWLSYVLTGYLTVSFVIAFLGFFYVIINLKQVLFYSEYIEFVNPIIKQCKRIEYSSVIKIVLNGKEDIKFSTNPSLIINIIHGSRKRRFSFSVKNDDSLFSVLSFLSNKKIKIEKNSNYKSHRDLPF